MPSIILSLSWIGDILIGSHSENGRKEAMTTAAIYCRVSTDSQESEGTSLQTQLEACLKYCQDKGYDVAYRFIETYSGLSLERPKLNELRELVRNEQIDLVVVYCLDRLSRNATHGVILRDELDKHHVMIESVTEDIDKTPLGEAITYLRGTFSQIEAEKIRERTMRGKKARAREGRMSGGFHTTYGYDYIKVAQEGGGRRIINETEASWVHQIYQWLANDGLSTNAITYRLRALDVPSKSGKIWCRRSVQTILKNPAYAGKTYAFTTAKGGQQFTRPQTDWIEIPGVTPAIISQDLFDAAQRQLQVNRQKTVPTTKHEYLLRGHIKCRQCGRSYAGTASVNIQNGKQHTQLFYRCIGRKKMFAPIERCGNKGWSARRLEAMVWAELEHYLSNRDLILNELEKQRQDANQLGVFEAELQQIERQLKVLDREQHQLLQWALKDFPADQVEAENKRLNKARETLKARSADLERQLKVSQDAVINIPKLEGFIERMQSRLPQLDFEGKRLALDMLGITVWLDGENVEVTGAIDLENDLQVVRCTRNLEKITPLPVGKGARGMGTALKSL
jgi:site-specific DNA recombinase